MVAERVSNTVRSSRSALKNGGEVVSVDRSADISNDCIEYDSVRISPSFMEFKDAFEGMTFRQLFIIQNVGKHPAHIRICSPNSIAFQVKTLQGGVFLSPGLRIRRWVHYSYKRTSVLHAMIPIYINWMYIDYHVICTLAKENLSVKPTSLDFGIVDIGSSSGIKTLTLKNDGGIRTRFAIDLGPNEVDISVRPMRGVVQARSKVLLRVELIGVEEGSFMGEFWIKSSPNIQVPVRVNIIIPRLIVYHPNTTGDFTLIDFSPTFVGTTRHDTIIIRNHSAQVSNFVVLGEIDNDLIPISNIKSRKHLGFQVFTVYPLEGRMDPFEGRIFNITFSPTVKAMKKSEESEKRSSQDFMVFVRIFRVHCTEVEDITGKEMHLDERTDEPFKKVQLLEPGSAVSLTMSDNEPPEPPGNETVRLCLYGEAEETRLNFVPDELHFGDVTIGESAHRELTISNLSNSTPVMYKFASNASAHCKPSTGRIEANKSVQVLITITGNYNVKIPFKLTFDVVIETCNLTNLKVSHMKGKPVWILGWYKSIIPLAKDQRGKSSPRITYSGGMGDRLLVKQVAFESDSKNPRQKATCVMNNRPVGTDNEYALTPEKAAFRSRHRLYWSNYVCLKRAQREKKALDCSNPTLIDINDCKDLLTAKLPKFKEQSIAKKMLNQAVAPRLVIKAADEILVPLSPLQIYNVKIAPTILAYGLVAPKSTNRRTLWMENLNAFPVMLRLVCFVSKAICFPNGPLVIIQPGEKITKVVEYRAQRVGKFNTYIDYIINDNHSFAITITANVVVKSLSLNMRELIFGNKYLPQEAYQPLSTFLEIKNKLDVTTSFTWDVRSNVSFGIYPTSGVVRGNRTLFAEVSYESIVSKSHNTEVILTSESGNWVNLRLDAILKKPDVAFVNGTVSLDRIPLNMTTTTFGVLHNAEFSEVMFQVDSSSLFYGCEIYPEHGIIPPRGIVVLEVRLKFDACFKFSLTVDVIIQKCLKLELKLIGQVSYPMLKLSPETISMKRISVDAFFTQLLTASNVGKTIIKVQFPLDEWPEYRTSFSPDRTDPYIDAEGFILLPGVSVPVYLHFTPTEFASYTFYLPVIINEILGPVLIESPKSIIPSEFLKPRETYYTYFSGIEITKSPPDMPTVYIDYTVSGHVISFSETVFHFDVMLNKVKDELRVSNKNSHREVSFIIRTDDFSEPANPFRISWLSGVEPVITPLSIVCTLRPEEEVNFLIEFKPLEQGKFKIEAPIFVRGELEGGMFNNLIFEGINRVSCVTCDKTELFFVPLPLGVEGEQKLTLKVGRCQTRFELVAAVAKPVKVVGTYTENCVQVKFVNGNIVTGKNSNEELDISVLFQSVIPVAFTTRIEFLIANAAVCSVSICATADNCVMTTYGFLRSTYELERTVRPPERISIPSLSSRGDGSSSLTKLDIFNTGKRGETILQSRPDAVKPSVSLISQKSMRIYGAKLKTDRIEDAKFEGINDDDGDRFSLNSKGSVAPPPLPSDQHAKLSKAFYPYFPTAIKINDADSHIQRTLNAAEQWMYSGGFKFNFNPTILDGVTAVLSGICSIRPAFKERRNSHAVNHSFIDLLVSLAGTDVLKCIGDTSSVPEDPVERVNYVLMLYDNVLEFLAVQGAFLPHVQSGFLLSYDDYLLSDKFSTKNCSLLGEKNSIRNEKMPKALFQSRSKQCWLDVALQTFKTLVLKRICAKHLQDGRNNPYNEFDSDISSSMSSAVSVLDYNGKKISNEEMSKDITQYSVEEILLLNWLQYHFELQRSQAWMMGEEGEMIPIRTVSNFEKDLADSLVLIAVTAAHCPYLINEHFSNLYIPPRNIEEGCHNAICLTTAWRRIRLGFMITTAQIVRPNCVQMVMLVAHLYFALPTFMLNTKIEFCCPLTETVTREISFSNTTEFPVSYIIEFIGNQLNLFAAGTLQSVVRVDAHSAGNLKIRYHARKMTKTKAYVILCGSSIAPNFARNHVFVLEGCTSSLGITDSYDIERVLYEVCDVMLNVHVPFKEAAEYEISLSEERPTELASLKLSKWVDLENRKVPRRLFINQKSISVLENYYKAELSITVACIAPTQRSFWIVFESENGDFIIQINSTSKKATTDYITVEWNRESCICSDLPNGISSTCPLNIKIGIPTRNTQLWNCVNHMFQKTLQQKEHLFWSRHLDTNIGLRLIHWLMGDYNDSAAKEFIHILKTSVTYDVTIADKKNFILPAQFLIKDVRPRNEEVEMSIHIQQTTPQVHQTTITLSSPDGMEYRNYKINFLCKTPIPRAATSKMDNRNQKRNKQR